MQQIDETTPVEPEPIHTNVVIIGAGPAGLAVAACLHRANFSYIMLERSDRVGVSWHGHYERLHLHTARSFSGLPYLPFPRSYPRYPSRLQMIEYLEGYAAHFGIRPRFNQQVVAAERVGSIWQITTQDSIYHASNLVIATGSNNRPFQPIWPGQEQFAGLILHSSLYRNGEPYRGKRVLVVGFGNSGGEIAIDLCEYGAQAVALAVRSPINVIPRDILGLPTVMFSIAQRKLRSTVADAINAPLVWMRYRDLERYGLTKSSDGPLAQIKQRQRIPLIDIGTIGLIRSGRIQVRPGIAEFTEHGVHFVDSSSDDYDAVILATGYHPAVDAFLTNAAEVTNEQGVPLTSGAQSTIPGLYFCGYTTTSTGMLREIGIEAKQITQQIYDSSSIDDNAL